MLTNTTVLGQIVVNGLNLSAVYILVALGFTLLFGIMRGVNFAHGEFAMLGGFAFYSRYAILHVPWVLAVVLGALAVAGPSLILEWLVFRWFYHKMFQSMIGLLGLGLVMTYTSLLVWDAFERNVPSAFDRSSLSGRDHSVGPVGDDLRFAGRARAFYLLMVHTKIRLAMRAAAQDVEIALTQGIDARKIYRWSFFVAVFLAALGGACMAQIYAVSPFMASGCCSSPFRRHSGRHGYPALGGILLDHREPARHALWGSVASTHRSAS